MSRNACPLCGHDDVPPDRMLSRGPLSVSVREPVLYWRGLRIPGVEPHCARLMIPLVRSGEAHPLSLSLLTGEDTSPRAVYVYIHKLRAAFERERLPVRIISPEENKGYRLVVDDDANNQNTQQIAGGRG